jgi:hypothetical protein
MRNVEELSEMIVGTLCERRGFDDWWFSLDENIQEEIQEKIQLTITDWQKESYDEEYIDENLEL